MIYRLAKVLFQWLYILIILCFLLLPSMGQVLANNTPIRTVNIPYWPSAGPEPGRAIFWFGGVNPYRNNIDVRLVYDDNQLIITGHIIDRLLWSDEENDISDITNWDAISVYIHTSDIPASTIDDRSFRFDAQLDNFQAAYQGTNANWKYVDIPFSIATVWRGDFGPNSGTDAKGWVVDLNIPFSAIGLTEAPKFRSSMRLGVILHDRDDKDGTIIEHITWPENMKGNDPTTWGVMYYGLPVYTPEQSLPSGQIEIREGLNGATVKDAHVGGHTTCGDQVDHWSEWGEANYAGYEQINIQNQWDISDWPCFSKYYLTIPLDSLPPGKVIINASLTMTLFGNAGGGDWGEPPDSYIQVFTIAEDWDEATLSWNNAPMALENISGTWVYPRDYNLPDQPYHWDVSKAVHEAYASGEPLRLALYSADGERHTGKYFWSSDTGDWNADSRPTLRVTIGDSSVPPQPSNHIFTYLPQVLSSNH